MDFNSYQRKILTFLNPKFTAIKADQLDNAVLGLSGESGEVSDLWKKHKYHEHDFDREKFKRELGDAMFYIADAADAIDCSLEEIAMINVAKLSARYPNGFSKEDSIAKKDEIVGATTGRFEAVGYLPTDE